MMTATYPLPALDPLRFNSLAVEGGDEDHITVYQAKLSFKEKDLAECTFNVLLAFRNSGIFPRLVHSELDFEHWEIYFRDSPFRSLRIRRSNVEGVVNIYAFGKKVRSFNVLESHHVWQLMVKWIWHYGRERQSDVRAWKAHQLRQGQPAKVSEPVPHPLVRQALSITDPNARAEKSPPHEGKDCMQEDTIDAKDISDGFVILSLLEQNNEMVLETQSGVENNALEQTQQES